jgi:hypothetical protein
VSGIVLSGVGVTLIIVGATSRSASPSVAIGVRGGPVSTLELTGAF